MNIGIIGAGNVARGVTQLVTGNGHQVVLSNSHGPETLSALVADLGTDVTAGTVADAAEEDIVVLAVPWIAVPDAVAGLPAWKARIVIDATNHWIRADDKLELADLGGRTSSEVVAGLLPGARVVKSFNSLPVRILERDPREGAATAFCSCPVTTPPRSTRCRVCSKTCTSRPLTSETSAPAARSNKPEGRRQARTSSGCPDSRRNRPRR